MKKIIYVFIILIGSSTSVYTAEKRDCSELKKFSGAFIACKAANLKSGIGSAGSGISKGLTKVGSGMKNAGSNLVKGVGSGMKNAGTTNKTTNTISNAKSSVKKSLSGLTKQYPKGTKKQ